MSKHGSYFYLMPSGIVTHDKISDGAKITYALILGLSNQYGYCFARNEKLCEMRNTSLSTLGRHIKELKDNNCIILEFNERSDRRIIPNIIATPYEKVSQMSKNGRSTEDWDHINDALDSIWKQMS